MLRGECGMRNGCRIVGMGRYMGSVEWRSEERKTGDGRGDKKEKKGEYDRRM